MIFSHRFACTAVLALATSLALAGCRGEDPAGSATDTDAATGTDGGSSTSGAPTTGGSTGDGSSTTALPTTTGNDTCAGGFIGCNDTNSTGGTPLGENGAMCASDDECMSGNCYTNPIAGGVCSDCNEDQDCVDAGTGISCSIGQMGWAVCEDGSLGDQCQSQAACQDGLFCDSLINIPIPGIIPDFCGECETSDDCNGLICTPELDLGTFTGAKKCVEKGSVPNDALCPVGEPDANDACMSGHCSVATVMAIVMIGLCGECETDADCMGGTCQAAVVDPNSMMFSGSKCI